MGLCTCFVAAFCPEHRCTKLASASNQKLCTKCRHAEPLDMQHLSSIGPEDSYLEPVVSYLRPEVPYLGPEVPYLGPEGTKFVQTTECPQLCTIPEWGVSTAQRGR